MDLIYRKEKYKQYLQRLHQLKEEHDQGGQLTEIRNGINEVLQDLKSKEDIKQNNLLYAVLLIPLVIVLIWLNIINGYIGWPFVPLVLLVAFFVLANLMMRNVIAENSELKWKGEISENDETSFLLYKLEYLKTGLKVKITRSNLIQFFFYIFFPFLLIFLYKLVKGSTAFDHIIVDYIVALVISTPLWWYYFKNERAEFDKTHEVINQFRSALQTISQEKG